MASSFRGWEDTKLWGALTNNTDAEIEAVRTTLSTWMPNIERILRQGGGSPQDFTLHDDQHAFRVAERMTELMPAEVLPALSSYEQALLLLSAYLHDIGMSPEQQRTRQHYDYLLTGQSGGMTEKQVKEFVVWLDAQNSQVTIPLHEGTPTPAVLRRTNLLVTHYARFKHVDWCDEWIDAHLAKVSLGSYVQWVDDLKILCRSHHQGYSDLVSDRFRPKPTGGAGLTVHTRYLAVLLRVADILEFDPERTPSVIFEHRDISPGSVIYWHKDHHVTRLLEGSRMTISSEPPDARIHRAVEMMTHDIEAELRLARRLDDEKPFEVSGFREETLPHKWGILPDLRQDIRPKNDMYEYIDGAFRPDTQKLLQLLSGKALYGDEMAAVRELLQNAFDAVREQIAYERLGKQNPNDPKWEKTFGETHEIGLRLEFQQDATIWLVCTDDGVGMTKSIIRDYLLVSGNSYHSDVRALERRCETAGFHLGRTGQFGIGVLSYFMIGDRVEVYTRRSTLAGDTDNTGWRFETDGIGTFGELRRDAVVPQGTSVRIRLRPEMRSILVNCNSTSKFKLTNTNIEPAISDEIASLVNGLASYIARNLSFLPCNFMLSSNIQKDPHIIINKGWNTTWDDDIEDLFGFFSTFKSHGMLFGDGNADGNADVSLPPLISRRQQELRKRYDEELERRASRANSLAISIESNIKWHEFQGDMDHNLGLYRLLIPVISLPSGHSPCYADESQEKDGTTILTSFRNNQDDRMTNEPTYLQPVSTIVNMSWKGFAVDFINRDDRPYIDIDRYLKDMTGTEYGVILQIDWRHRNAGSINIDRESLQLSDDGQEALLILRNHIYAALESLAEIYRDSSYSSLFLYARSMKRHFVKPEDLWLYNNSCSVPETIWGTIPLPCIHRADTDKTLRECDFKWKGKDVAILRDEPGILRWRTAGLPPDRIVKIAHDSQFYVMPLHTTGASGKRRSFGYTCNFPPEWRHLVGVKHTSPFNYSLDSCLNADHPLVLGIDKDAETWIYDSFFAHRLQIGKSHDIDPRPYHDTLSSVPSRAKAWLVAALSTCNLDMWSALAEQDPELLISIWQSAFSDMEGQITDNTLFFLGKSAASSNMRSFDTIWSVNIDKQSTITDVNQIIKILPDPENEWVLEAHSKP